MRPPRLRLPLLPLLLLAEAAAVLGSFPDAPPQLPAPQNLKIRLHNAEQVLSWEPGSPSDEAGPVVYQVQFKYPISRRWTDVTESSVGVNCSRIPATECDFTRSAPGFLCYFNVSLRVRAQLPGRVSAWALAPWFQHYRNVTIGPPAHVWVTPGEGSLVVRVSPPFTVADPSMVAFQYYVRYWEKAGSPQAQAQAQEQGPFGEGAWVLRELRPLREHCLQVRALLLWPAQGLARLGPPSNVSCHEAAADASTQLQRSALIGAASFLALAALAGFCVFLMLRSRSLIKHWFQSPPRVPKQIEEYLKDPAQHFLEALAQDSPSEDEAWDVVSEVSPSEQEPGTLSQAEDALPTL